MNLTGLLGVLSTINNKTKEYNYLLLLFIVGSVTIYESVRISNKYIIKDWLSGPSGFVMVIGCLILFLALIEGLSIIRDKRTRKQVPPFQTAIAATLDTSPDELSGEALKCVGVTADKIGEQKSNNQDHHNMRNLVFSYALLIMYVLTIKLLGFTISTAIYMFSNLLLLKNSRLLTFITVAALIICTMYGAPAMGLSLPRGIFGF